MPAWTWQPHVLQQIEIDRIEKKNFDEELTAMIE